MNRSGSCYPNSKCLQACNRGKTIRVESDHARKMISHIITGLSACLPVCLPCLRVRPSGLEMNSRHSERGNGYGKHSAGNECMYQPYNLALAPSQLAIKPAQPAQQLSSIHLCRNKSLRSRPNLFTTFLTSKSANPTRPTLWQFQSFKTRRQARKFGNVDRRVLRLLNCVRVGRDRSLYLTKINGF